MRCVTFKRKYTVIRQNIATCNSLDVGGELCIVELILHLSIDRLTLVSVWGVDLWVVNPVHNPFYFKVK